MSKKIRKGNNAFHCLPFMITMEILDLMEFDILTISGYKKHRDRIFNGGYCQRYFMPDYMKLHVKQFFGYFMLDYTRKHYQLFNLNVQLNNYNFVKDCGAMRVRCLILTNYVTDLRKVKWFEQHAERKRYGLRKLCVLGEIRNLDGIERFGRIEILELSVVSDLETLKGLEKLSTLTTLRIVNNATVGSEILDRAKHLNLRTLELISVGFRSLNGIESFVHLQSLDLKNNEIRTFDEIKKLCELRYLCLCGNQITSVADLQDLKRLKVLCLSRNRITSVKALKNLKCLEILCLSRNQISDVGPLANLTNLKSLSLHNNNRISRFDGIRPLAKRLEYLALDYQKVNDSFWVIHKLMLKKKLKYCCEREYNSMVGRFMTDDIYSSHRVCFLLIYSASRLVCH